MSSNSTTTNYDTSRGASLSEYALVLGLVLVAMIGAIDALTTSSGDLLDDVGDDIGEARPDQNVVIETQVVPPPAYVPPVLPPPILTWVDQPVATPEGCLSVAGTVFSVVPCDQPTATPFNGLSEDGILLNISLVDESGCLTGDTTGPAPVVTMTPCGLPSQDWTELSLAGTVVAYQHAESGLCLQTVVPGGADPLTLAPCDGSPAQTIEVRF